MASSASEFHGARGGCRQVSGITELYFFICPKRQAMSIQQEMHIYDVARTTVVKNFYFLSLVCCYSDSQNIDAHSAGLSPGGSMVKNLPASSGDLRATGSTPGSGRSPRERNGNPLQYSCLENPMDRGAWWVTVHGVSKSGHD